MKKIVLSLVIVLMTVPVMFAQLGDATNFTAFDANGKKVDLFEYKDKLILLDFWATWCGPCRREIPNLVNIKNTYKDEPFEIISIALERGDAGFENAKQFVKDNNMNWVHIIDKNTNMKIAQDYHIQYIPTMYLIRNKKVLSSGATGEQLKAQIAKFLGK